MLAHFFFLALLLIGGGAEARMTLTGAGAPPVVSSGYTGPGDIVSSASYWGGLRAYSSAVAATGTQKSVKLRRASDNVTCDVLIATSGSLGLTTSTCNSSTQGGITPTAFAGTDTTGTGAIVGTALTFTGGHLFDVVTGSGVTAGTYITGGSSPNWTVTPSQTVVSTTLTLTWGLFVDTLYDQSGSGNDATQPTAGFEPMFLANGALGIPSIINLTAANNEWLIIPLTNISSTSGGVVWVQNPATAFNSGAVRKMWAQGGGPEFSCQVFSDNNWYCGWSTGSDTRVTLAASSGNYPSNSWSDYALTWAPAGTVLYRSGSSIGTQGSTPATSNLGLNMGMLGNTVGASTFFPGAMVEFGIWKVAVSSGNASSLSSNAKTFWGY